MKKLSISAMFLIGLFSCERRIPNSWDLPPNQFWFQIKQNGTQLSESCLNALKLFYIENGQRVYEVQATPGVIPDSIGKLFIRRPSDMSLYNAGICWGPYVNAFEIRHNTWYFEFPNGDIDTLYVENKIISKEEGKNNPCYCVSPFTVVRYNGKDAAIHPTLKANNGKLIYILEKQ